MWWPDSAIKVDTPEKNSRYPKQPGPRQVAEVRVRNKWRGSTGEQRDQTGDQSDAKWPRLLFLGQRITAVRKHYACTDSQNQKRETTHKHDVQQIDAILRNARCDPKSCDQKPVSQPDAPCQCRTHSRKSPW